MKRTYTYRCMMMAAILLQAFLVSCTQVEFSGMVESFDGMESFARTNMSKVAFNVTLPENLVDGNQPQYMTVLLNRTRAEMCRYVYNLDADGVAIPEESDTLVINDGFYLVSSIAAGSPEDFKISELDSFKTDDALLISDMYVSIPRLDTDDIISQGYIDFNPKYPYLRAVEPMYVVKPDQSSGESIFSYRKTPEEAKLDHVIDLKYSVLTRRLDFDLEIGIGEGVDVGRVICSVSGIPQKVQLMNGHVTDKNTCKVPFEMTHVGEGKYTGHVDVLGLFSGQTDSLYVGLGVFNVIVHVSTVANGRTINRISYENYNLKKAIDASGLMLPTEDGKAYKLNENPETTSFSLGRILTITKEDIITGSGQGCEFWEGSDEDEDVLINPGLNPEM